MAVQPARSVPFTPRKLGATTLEWSMAEDDEDQLERDLDAAFERRNLAEVKRLSGVHLERERRRANDANRTMTLRNWSEQVRAELEHTVDDPHRRLVLQRRRQVYQLRDAERVMRETVEQWPVLRRDAFPPGEDMDRAFAAMQAATEAMELVADTMTSALWVTVPMSKKAEAHLADKEEALSAIPQAEDAWRERDRDQADRDAREAEAHGRQARAHHVEASDVDELIIREMVADGVPEADAIMATIDHVPDKPAVKRRARARTKWLRENSARLFRFHRSR